MEDNESLSVKRVQMMRKRMEDDIYRSIADFEQRTLCVVSEIYINRVTIERENVSQDRVMMLSGVSTKIILP